MDRGGQDALELGRRWRRGRRARLGQTFEGRMVSCCCIRAVTRDKTERGLTGQVVEGMFDRMLEVASANEGTERPVMSSTRSFSQLAPLLFCRPGTDDISSNLVRVVLALLYASLDEVLQAWSSPHPRQNPDELGGEGGASSKDGVELTLADEGTGVLSDAVAR